MRASAVLLQLEDRRITHKLRVINQERSELRGIFLRWEWKIGENVIASGFPAAFLSTTAIASSFPHATTLFDRSSSLAAARPSCPRPERTLRTLSRMPSVEIRPTVREYGVNQTAYENFLVELRAHEIDARIEQPSERRSGGIEHAAAVAIYVFEHADNLAAVVGAVVLALNKLKKPRSESRPRRRATIYGPNGDALREIDLD